MYIVFEKPISTAPHGCHAQCQYYDGIKETLVGKCGCSHLDSLMPLK